MLHYRSVMHGEERAIKEVVKKVRQGQPEEISVVLCTDGSYGISRNGKIMPGLHWPAEQLDECVAFAERFSQTDYFPRNDRFAGGGSEE